MRKLFTYTFLFLAIHLLSCRSANEEQLSDIKIDTKDPVFQKIRDLQDRQQVDSLYAYFKNENPVYRYLAVAAFGSIKSKVSIDTIAPLLKDPSPEVRAAAAFALGQIKDIAAEKHLIAAFEQTDTAGTYKKANRAILEALGKCGSPETLQLLSTITTYQPKDTALLEGQALGLYRYSLREMVVPEGTLRMVELASQKVYPESVRLVAAHYFTRAKSVQLDSLIAQPLIEAIENEENTNIRMALAIAVGKAKTLTAFTALSNLYQKETDYRVKCNILRAFHNFEYDKIQAIAMNALRDPQIHVAATAGQFFVEKGIPEDAGAYWRLAKDSLPWQVQIELYAAAMRHLPPTMGQYRDAINLELRRRFAQVNSPYHKAATLRALSEWGWNFRFIQREGFSAPHPAIRTASVEALAALCEKRNYQKFFGSSNNIAKELAIYFKQAIQSGDPAMMATAAIALRNPDRNFKTQLDSLSFLDKALASLALPKEIETYNELKKTIDYLKGNKDSEPQPVAFNHPIDWKTFNMLIAEPTVLLRTKRGEIKIRLLPEIAPGTVVNFVKLAKEGFYDGKNFHRVVSNFVIQGGCPRGDGYGSLDYSIRSELPPIYYDREGLVGMASAGNHTEGTQFFITHSPTPHLDGNYTIFGRVIEGMDAVHAIRAGDVIDKVLIL